MWLRQAYEEVQRLKAQGCFAPMKKAAQTEGLPLAFVCAIASRETHCDNVLGDFRHGVYHGTGVMQIDIQHEISREAQVNRTWKEHPGPLIRFGCHLLKTDLEEIAGRYPDLYGPDRLKLTAAAYDAGLARAIQGYEEGFIDYYTTYRNYGGDVMARMCTFEEALA